MLGARRLDRLEALAAEITAAGGHAVALRVDVTRRDDLVRLVETAGERHGKLDVLVGNAGVGPISPLDDLRVAEWEQMIDVNLKGVLYGVAAALPVFRAQRYGHFVHVASTAGLKTVPNQAVYSATKVAVRAFTEGLRQEAGDKLRVTLVTPGFVRTEFVEGVSDANLRNSLVRRETGWPWRRRRSPAPSPSRSSSPPRSMWARSWCVRQPRPDQAFARCEAPWTGDRRYLQALHVCPEEIPR